MDESKPPWKKPNPKKSKHKKLTPALLRMAKASARAAGRPYPNLIDNMKAAQAGKKVAKKKSAKENFPSI